MRLYVPLIIPETFPFLQTFLQTFYIFATIFHISPSQPPGVSSFCFSGSIPFDCEKRYFDCFHYIRWPFLARYLFQIQNASILPGQCFKKQPSLLFFNTKNPQKKGASCTFFLWAVQTSLLLTTASRYRGHTPQWSGRKRRTRPWPY